MTDKLQEYAQLLINVGLNVQKDQYVVISSQVDCAYFARMCIAAAYEAGAKQVIMNWNDDFATRQYYLNAADEVFDQVFPWEAERPIGLLKKGACFLTIAARDPENLKGVDPERIARANIANGKANEEFSIEMMNSAVQWCIASIPVPSWAKKVFPDLSEEQAMEKLWEEIFKAVRITGCGDGASIAKFLKKSVKSSMLTISNLSTIQILSERILLLNCRKIIFGWPGPNSARAESSLLQTCQQRKFSLLRCATA